MSRFAAGNVGGMAATNEEVEASRFPILGYVYAAVIVLCLLSFRSGAAPEPSSPAWAAKIEV